MTRTRKPISIALAIFVCVCVVGTYFFFLFVLGSLFGGESGTPSSKQSAIDTTLEWGRLAPFPASAREFSITTAGNMFTRSFSSSFTAPLADIDQWLQQSPGTREATPMTISPGLVRFNIAPGGGAQRAQVTVDYNTNRVFVYVCWS